MGKKELALRRRYTDESKLKAVKLAESIGANRAATQLGVPDSSLRNWLRLSRAGKLRAERAGTPPVKCAASKLEAENARLRRELANAKSDLEIVKRAAAYFAKEFR